MIRKQALAFALFGLAGTSAMADDITIDNSVFVSQRTRAEVRAEVIAARQAGALGITEADIVPAMAASLTSSLTRDDVRMMVTAAARATFLKLYPA